MRVNGDDRGADSPSSGRPLSSSAQPSPMRNLSSASGGLYVSAPGKIILFGEHAVVYGRTAIAGSIDLRTYVSLFTSADGRIYLSLPDLGVEKTWMLKDLIRAGEKLAADYPVDETQAPSLELLVPMARKLSGSCEDQCGVQHLAILAFWYVLLGVAHRKSSHKMFPPEGEAASQADTSMDLLAVKTTVRFELPSCVGLGSSGAFCVCIVTALLQSSGLIPPPTIVADAEGNMTWEEDHLDTIRKWSTAAESLIHGRASGLDAAVCTYGGVASFTPGARIEHLKNLPDLRVILVNSKVERNTSRMVQTVKERRKRFPDVVEGVFHSIDAISKEAAGILGKAAGSDHDGENGEGAGDGTSAPPTPLLLNGGTQPLGLEQLDHRSLQPHSGSVRSASLSSYISAGKRDSCASALSGCSTAAGGASGRSGELVDTFAKLNELCRMNNQLLIALGVGHPKIDQICTTLARYGIHPKMTGAGGGGCAFAFLKPDTTRTLLDMMTSELVKFGYDVYQPPLGGPGVVEHARRPALFSTPIATAPGAAAAAGGSSCGGSSGTSALSTPSLHHK